MKKLLVAMFVISLLGLAMAAEAGAVKEDVKAQTVSYNAQAKADWKTFQQSLQGMPTADRKAAIENYKQQQHSKRVAFRDSKHAEKISALQAKLDATTLNAEQKAAILSKKEAKYQASKQAAETKYQARKDAITAILNDTTLTKEQKKEKIKALRAADSQQPSGSVTTTETK
jgi:hypothetical protein